jgi:hypothetical protein
MRIARIAAEQQRSVKAALPIPLRNMQLWQVQRLDLVIQRCKNHNINRAKGGGRCISWQQSDALHREDGVRRVQELELAGHLVHVLAAVEQLRSAASVNFDSPYDGRLAALRSHDAEIFSDETTV